MIIFDNSFTCMLLVQVKKTLFAVILSMEGCLLQFQWLLAFLSCCFVASIYCIYLLSPLLSSSAAVVVVVCAVQCNNKKK